MTPDQNVASLSSSLMHAPQLQIQAVRLQGSRRLLGAEKVTWRFQSAGLNVVSGANGSGKTLLCSALCASLYPNAHSGLIAGLRDAGLSRITLRLYDGQESWTHSLDLLSDECGVPTGVAEIQPLPMSQIGLVLPHIVLNGQWPELDTDVLDWSRKVSGAPLLRERDLWVMRRSALERGAGSGSSPDQIRSELDALEEELKTAESKRIELERAIEERSRLSAVLQEQFVRRQIFDLEAGELTKKIEAAERAGRLQEWHSEIQEQRKNVEQRRADFEALHEELDRVRGTLSGLPDSAEAMAQRYLDLKADIRARAEEQEALARAYDETLARLDSLKRRSEDLASGVGSPDETERHELAHRLADAENKLTELHRTRIDLLRKNDGLHRTMSESLRDVSSLLPDEIALLREYADLSDDSSVAVVPIDSEDLQGKIAGVRRTMKEFAGLEMLPADAEEQVKTLYGTREFISERILETDSLKHRIAMIDPGKHLGAMIGLSLIGAAAAGIPTLLTLGSDIGFFGALVGGGLGFTLARLLSQSQVKELGVLHSQLASCQQELSSAVDTRDSLKKALRPIAGEDSLEHALAKLHQYRDLLIAEREIAQQMQALAAAPVAASATIQPPPPFRSMDRADIRVRLDEYDATRVEIDRCAHELLRYERGGDLHHQASDLEAAIQTHELELRDWDDHAARLKHEVQDQLKDIESRIRADETKLAALTRALDAGADVSLLEQECVKLNAECSGKLETPGAVEILGAAEREEQLEARLREIKQRLTLEHSWQELASRASVIEDELRDVVDHVRAMDPLFAEKDTIIGDLLKYRAQLDDIAAQTEEARRTETALQKRLHGIELERLEAERLALRSEEIIEQDLSAARTRLDDVLRSITAAARMVESLDAEIADIEQQGASRQLQHLQKCVFEAAGERVVSVEPSDQGWEATLEDGSRKLLSRLPRGLAELIRLSLSYGALTWSKGGERLPVLWDDVCSQLDDMHLESARRLLHALSNDRQVILFSRDPRIRAWGGTPDVLVGEHEFELIA